MDLLLNDLSLHGQFPDLAAFRDSIRQVMRIRELSRRYNRALYCHRGFANGQVTPGERMPEAVRALPQDERRAVMAWLCLHGPFWEDERLHDSGDWYEHAGMIVTDTAIGEIAHCLLQGIERGLVSLQPSNFMFDPIPVERVFDEGNRVPVDLRNFWELTLVEACFAESLPPLASWSALRERSVRLLDHLRFAENAFEPLSSHPFKQGVAERIFTLLNVLQRFKQCFDENGSRNEEGNAMYQMHFASEEGWFSDESNGNKAKFKSELTFPNPDNPGETLFCSMHGKVKTPQIRIHFSWPITDMSPVYVVYIGPKISKK